MGILVWIGLILIVIGLVLSFYPAYPNHPHGYGLVVLGVILLIIGLLVPFGGAHTDADALIGGPLLALAARRRAACRS